MKPIRSSIAELSRQGIAWSSQPTENCHPSIRSNLLPIYPGWTREPSPPCGRLSGEQISVAALHLLQPPHVMPGLVPRLSGWSFRRCWRDLPLPPLWGKAGKGGRANLTEYGSFRGFGEVGRDPPP
jgi:hypothetical protein